MSREYCQPGMLLRPYGLPDDIPCTDEHPIWARPTKRGKTLCPVCGEKFKGLSAHLRQRKDPQHARAYKDFERAAEGWIRADQLCPGDWVRTPFNTEVTETEDPAYAALLGWYTSEGYAFDSEAYTEAHWCVDFTVGSHEAHYAEEIKNLLLACGSPEQQISVYDQKEHSRIIVRCRHVPLMRRLVADGGNLAGGKRLAARVMLWPPEIQKILLDKHIEGDGDWNPQNESLKLTTVSRRLAFQLAEIAWRNNIPALIGKGKLKPGGFIKGRQILSRLPAYTVTIRGDALCGFELKKLSGFQYSAGLRTGSIAHLKHQAEGSVRTWKTAKALTYIEDGFVYRRLAKVKLIRIDETVHDLTVPGDHSFVVNGIGVSNCRVPYDICSCCENRAKRASLYCDHLKYHMNQWMPEFRKYAFAINDRPTFYDMSRVNTPADRIARYLEYRFGDDELRKAASTPLLITGEEWARFEGVDIPDPDEAIPFSILKHAMLYRLAEEEKWFAEEGNLKNASLKSAFARDVAPQALIQELTEEELQEIRTLRPSTLMHELAKSASILPFISFAAYITGKSLAETRDSLAVKRAAALHVPRIFSTLLETGDEPRLSEMFEARGKMLADCDAAKTAAVDACLLKIAGKATIDTAAVQDRLLHQEDLKPHMDMEVVKSAVALDHESAVLAQAYGLYQLNALCDMESEGHEIREPHHTLIVGANQRIYR